MARHSNIPKRKLFGNVKILPKKNIKLAQLIQDGLFFHQQGKFKEAQVCYERVLAIHTNHFDALKLLGVLSAQTKQFIKAVDFLTKALKINPNDAACYSNRGVALKELELLEEALTSYDQAISIKPDYAEALSNRGNVLLELNRFEEALATCEKAICIKPDYADAHYNRGIALQELGRLGESLASYDQVISINSDYVEAYFNRGVALKALGRLEESHISFCQAINIKSDYAEAYYNCGIALQELKRLEEALECYDQAINIKPDYVEVYTNQGFVLKALGRLEESLASFDRAIWIKPDYADAHYNRGNSLQELGRLEDAIVSYEKVIDIKPNHADAYTNRGNALQDLNFLEEAIVSYDQAINSKAEYAEAFSNRGVALQKQGRIEEALVSYFKAIATKPDYAEAHWNLSLCHLLTGNFKDGTQGYEWRLKREDINKNSGVRSFQQPLWLGEGSILDKTILLYADQGLGDTIQFSRYAPLVAQTGAKVILEVQRPLINLLKNLEGVSQLIARDDPLPTFDYQCPLSSLMLAFKTELNSIPPASQFITGNCENVLKWHTKLGKKVKSRVGLVWSGSTGHKNDQNRSLTLSKLLPHLPSNIEYFCLQKEIRQIDKEFLAQHNEIKYFCDSLEDFIDTAALCELMDVVISVDTSVAHLAGTLGKPTWVLLPFSPDWRWLLDRDDNPWYSSVKLYRQESISDWDGVLEKVKLDLEKLQDC